jgi:anti-sigma B factor antagonist
MDINVSSVRGVTVVELVGELTGKSAPEAQQRILEQTKSASRVILEMTRVSFLSSAGLRVLLMVYRSVSGQGGRALLVGLSGEIRNTMSVTGFLDFFVHRDTLDAGLAELALE